MTAFSMSSLPLAFYNRPSPSNRFQYVESSSRPNSVSGSVLGSIEEVNQNYLTQLLHNFVVPIYRYPMQFSVGNS